MQPETSSREKGIPTDTEGSPNPFNPDDDGRVLGDRHGQAAKGPSNLRQDSRITRRTAMITTSIAIMT